MKAVQDLERTVRGAVERGVPLAPLTTYRIGGPAAVLVHPADAEDVGRALQFAAETGMRWFVLGLGSNVLVADRGFDGLVLRVGKRLGAVVEEAAGDAPRWRVGAGAPIPLVARRTAEAGCAGVHRLVGVPGTVGGGVFMNAGAHGQEFGRVVERIELVGEDGEVRILRGDAVAWRYRESGLRGVVVTGVSLRLARAPVEELKHDIRRHFAWRKAGTPFSEPCCGSVFRNPPPDASGGRTAGQLIEAAGLKGFRIGGAVVSPKHANYIVNVGGARAADVEAVIDAVRRRVQEAFGIELELEVQIVR